MNASLIHGGLPDGVSQFRLCDLIDKISRGSCKAERIPTTAVRLLRYYVLASRPADFEAGRICGVYEQPQTTAAALGISTKVLHNAEAHLRDAGFIERTHSPHARRSGKRHNGVIVALAGISLKPLIDGWAKWHARREAMELQAKALFCLKQEIAALNRQVRCSGNPDAIERAGDVLPRGRVSRIDDPEKLGSIRDALQAILVLLEVPSGATRSSDRTEEIVTPNVPESNSFQTRRLWKTDAEPSDRSAKITPAMAASVASENYRSLLPQDRAPTWRDLLDTSAIVCRWHGVSEAAFAQACERLGREGAAVAVIVVDRNAHLPQGHRYRARSAPKCLAGLSRNASGLTSMLQAMKSYREDRYADCGSAPEPVADSEGRTLASAAFAVLAKLSVEDRS